MKKGQKDRYMGPKRQRQMGQMRHKNPNSTAKGAP